MSTHEPGLALNGAFYRDVVARILADHPHAAALLGWGSEVLGYDTERSTDHGWGPRLLVFVDPRDVDDLRHVLDRGLPKQYGGWPVRFGWDAVPVQHHVTVTTVADWCQAHLGVQPDAMSTLDWLVVPQQRLLEATAGRVYADPAGDLEAMRASLGWYPDQVWRWMIACQWSRIAREEAFVGRAAQIGDELGSRVVAGRLVRELMRMAFLLARRYWPYSKWFGRAFTELPDNDGLGAALMDTLAAPAYPARETALGRAYVSVAVRYNAAALSAPVDPDVRPYYQRPFRVLMAERFVNASKAAVTDPWLAALPLIGSVDQLIDATDVLQHSQRVALRPLYVPTQS